MTLVYHGTPIPLDAMRALGPRAFCVSYEPRSRRSAPHVERQATALMYDNGEFARYTAVKRGEAHGANWRERDGLYEWLEPRLFQPGRWAVIPDVIDGGLELQEHLIDLWPFGHKGAPVWHTDEPLDRLLNLVDRYPRVCFGSAGAHWQVGGPDWTQRMDEVWDVLDRRSVRPVIHGMRMVGVADRYPFDSADSTGFAQSMHRYRQPLFAGTPDEWTGIVAFADKLERRAAVGLLPFRHPTNNQGRTGRIAINPPGPFNAVPEASVLPITYPEAR